MSGSTVLYGVTIQQAADKGDLSALHELHAKAVAQRDELDGHIQALSDHIAAAGGKRPPVILPYGVAVQEATIPPYGTPIQDRGVVPLYGVVDQAGSAVPLYGVPPNPIPLYGVVIQDAADSGDVSRMKAIASAVRTHLDKIDELEAALKKLG